jgi:hypothetical protein
MDVHPLVTNFLRALRTADPSASKDFIISAEGLAELERELRKWEGDRHALDGLILQLQLMISMLKGQMQSPQAAESLEKLLEKFPASLNRLSEEAGQKQSRSRGRLEAAFKKFGGTAEPTDEDSPDGPSVSAQELLSQMKRIIR